MKLLIITSEPLNPDSIISSTFELSQAKILKELGEIAILSVSPKDSLSASIKTLIKSAWRGKLLLKRNSLKRAANIFSTLVFGHKKVSIYSIEDVPVYEGKDFQFKSSIGFLPNLDYWVKAGLASYKAYEKKHGKPDIIHAHGRFLNAGALALELKKNYRISYVYTEHSTAYQSGTAAIEARQTLNDIIDHASMFVAVSKSLLRQLEIFLQRNFKDAIILPNTLDPVFETPVKAKTNRKDYFGFITIASLHKKKGLHILLKAFKMAFGGSNKYCLSIYGDGPLRQELEQIRNDLDLRNCVSFGGNISKEEIIKKLDEADVLVVSSLEETFGVVIIEALSRGCPVIATKSGGPEFILTDQYGILVERGNELELSQAMVKMSKNLEAYDRHKLHEETILKYGKEAFLSASKQLYFDALSKEI
jgi:glycosyltransferase involved in cell wall biosynthesis